jgi:hypothetical protein
MPRKPGLSDDAIAGVRAIRLRLPLRQFPREAFLGAGLDLRAGRGEFFQPVLMSRQCFGDRRRPSTAVARRILSRGGARRLSYMSGMNFPPRNAAGTKHAGRMRRSPCKEENFCRG